MRLALFLLLLAAGVLLSTRMVSIAATDAPTPTAGPQGYTVLVRFEQNGRPVGLPAGFVGAEVLRPTGGCGSGAAVVDTFGPPSGLGSLVMTLSESTTCILRPPVILQVRFTGTEFEWFEASMEWAGGNSTIVVQVPATVRTLPDVAMPSLGGPPSREAVWPLFAEGSLSLAIGGAFLFVARRFRRMIA